MPTPPAVLPSNPPRTHDAPPSPPQPSLEPGVHKDSSRNRSGRPPASTESGGRGSLWLLLIVSLVAAAGWYWRAEWLPWIGLGPKGEAAAGGKPAPRAMPVKVAPVTTRDFDIYLNALGTVTPFKTVAVQSRVEGELTSVSFKEGQSVEQNDLLATVDARPYEAQLAQAEGQLARDQSQLELARLTLSRNQDLLRRRSISQQEVDTAAALVRQLEGTIKVDQAMVDNARLQVDYCRITAPISGRIGLRTVDQGNMVRANDARGLAVITQLQPISVVFTIPQDDIPRVQERVHSGQSLAVDAYDRDFKTRIASGSLSAIDNQVDPMTGTLRLKAEFTNDDNALFPNQFVNVRLRVETRRNAVVVPSSAVQQGPIGAYVYRLGRDQKVDLQPVEIGPSEGPITSILQGLNVGDQLVTDGIDKLQPGATVSVKSDSKPEPGKTGREPGTRTP